jgi:hypothetical protein
MIFVFWICREPWESAGAVEVERGFGGMAVKMAVRAMLVLNLLVGFGCRQFTAQRKVLHRTA